MNQYGPRINNNLSLLKMLSRISKLAKTNHYHSLTKLPHSSLFISRPQLRIFSTENKQVKDADESGTTTQEEPSEVSEVSEASGISEEEEETTAKVFKKKGVQQQSRNSGKSTLFQKEPSKSSQTPKELEQINFKSYKETQGYAVQIELIKLLESKGAISDPEKAQYIQERLEMMSNDPQKLIDRFTYEKLMAIINEEKFDEEAIFEQIEPNVYQGAQQEGKEFIPYRDTYKEQEMDDLQRLQKEEKQLQEENKEFLKYDGKMQLDWHNFGKYKDGQRQFTLDQAQPYEVMIYEIQQEVKTLLTDDSQNVFKLDRVTDDVKRFRNNLNVEEFLAGVQMNEHLDQKEIMDTIEADMLEDKTITKEEVKKYQDDMRKDVFFALREDFKSEYEQTRSYMKLNQHLRYQIASHMKGLQNMLAVAKRQREKYFIKLQNASRDFTFDIPPTKAFDFIHQEKELQSSQTNQQQQKGRNQEIVSELKAKLLKALHSDDILIQIQALADIIESQTKQPHVATLVHKEVLQEKDYEISLLFRHMVDKLDSRQIIDKASKEDAMWKIIDYFSKYNRPYQKVLREEDMALYFKNHFNDSKTFERVMSVSLRQNETSQFSEIMQKYLNEFRSMNKTMPFSFDEIRIRNTYLRLKAANKAKQFKVSEKVAEYLMFLMKSGGMNAELVDLCENYGKLTGNTSGDFNETKNYYLSDALLRMKVESKEKYYYQILKDAVFNDENVTPCYITQMTKAYFKDQADPDHALKFFEENLHKLRKVKQDREEFLISIFDKVYGKEKQEISLEEFKEKYLKTMKISNQALKEAFVVQQLKRILDGKEYDEIETLFQLQLVLKEERQILTSLKNHNSDLDTLLSTRIEDLQIQSPDIKIRLRDVRDRKLALTQKLQYKDVDQFIEIANFIKSNKIEILKDISELQADQIQSLFNLQSRDQIESILNKTQYIQKSIPDLIDDQSEVFQLFAEKTEKAMNKDLKLKSHQIYSERQFPEKTTPNSVKMAQRKQGDMREEFGYEIEEADEFAKYMLEDEITDQNDPVVIKQEAQLRTIIDMKEDLLDAVNQRKGKALKVALEIFNKVQESKISTFRLDDVGDKTKFGKDQDSLYGNIDTILQKYDILLNSPRSPIISALQTLAQYKGDKGMASFSQIYKDGIDMLTNRIDYQKMKNENDKLQSISDELSRYQLILKNINTILIKEQEEVNKNQSRKHAEGANDEYQQKYEDIKVQEAGQRLDQRAQQLYQDYLKQEKGKEYSREEKLKIMRDALYLEYGQAFTSNDLVFPSFFSQDLIIFGIENNIPEAVRLGEKMMSQTGQTLSREMAMAVKNYVMEHSEKYQESIKKTGPIDNASLYRGLKYKMKPGEQVPVFYIDDPYWQDFLWKHHRKTEMWRIPSHLAWNHNPRGVLDEVVDFDKLSGPVQIKKGSQVIDTSLIWNAPKYNFISL